MEFLERLATIAKPERERVEQLGVRGCRPILAKITERLDNAAPKVPLPDAIHNAAPGERVLFARQPACQRSAALAFVGGVGEFYAKERPWPDGLFRALDLAAIQ